MFSIVIPLYNKALSISSTIQSVLDQSYPEFELVIVNDGSTDASAAAVEAFDDPRIRLIQQENRGVSVARNKGIEEASYEWIAFLDADDLWKSNHLQTIIEMQKLYPDHKVFSTSFEYSDGRKVSFFEESPEVFRIDDYFKEADKEHHIWTGVVAVHLTCLRNVGRFNPLLFRGEDLDLWARLGKSYVIIKSVKVTAVYRIEAENRACKAPSTYGRSIVSTIDLKGLKGAERGYYKKMLFRRLKGNIKNLEFKEMAKIIIKHHLNLLK